MKYAWRRTRSIPSWAWFHSNVMMFSTSLWHFSSMRVRR